MSQWRVSPLNFHPWRRCTFVKRSLPPCSVFLAVPIHPWHSCNSMNSVASERFHIGNWLSFRSGFLQLSELLRPACPCKAKDMPKLIKWAEVISSINTGIHCIKRSGTYPSTWKKRPVECPALRPLKFFSCVPLTRRHVTTMLGLHSVNRPLKVCCTP